MGGPEQIAIGSDHPIAWGYSSKRARGAANRGGRKRFEPEA